MIGGGDYKTLPDSMFQCREVVNKYDSSTYNLQFMEKKRMNFARHGHSCCTILDRYIIVSGSRKEVNNAANRVELYDVTIDEWLELPRINEGRHYHSSCHFNHRFVYVFGGIQNSNKKYSCSIERFQFDIDNLYNKQWERVNLQKTQMPSPITARQGAGMCQIGPDEIVIVGGFNGKFLNDYFTI